MGERGAGPGKTISLQEELSNQKSGAKKKVNEHILEKRAVKSQRSGLVVMGEVCCQIQNKSQKSDRTRREIG